MLRWFFVFLVMAATSLSAASKQPYGLGVLDELKRLDRAGLEESARPLVRRGAAVAVVLVQRGGQPDAAKQLAQLGLFDGSQIVPAGLYLYVSLDPHYSELRVGSRFSDELPPGQLEQIRDRFLNPPLRNENYQQGFVDSLGELERRLSHSRTLSEWLGLASIVPVALYLMALFGFWEWLVDTPPARALLWLWSLTPWARAKQRQKLEAARLDQLRLLQNRAGTLVDARQNLKMMRCPRTEEFDLLKQQVKEADPLAIPQLTELRLRVEAETELLERLNRHFNAGTRQLVDARETFHSIRSALKARKKTRPLLESPEFQELESEIRQESDLRKRYGDEGAELDEWRLSEERCQKLHQRAREMADLHGLLKKASTPIVWTGGSPSSESSTSYNSPSSSSDEHASSYEPPTSSSESWAGGSW